MRHILLLLCCVLFHAGIAGAQDKNDIAIVYYGKAEAAYNDANYPGAIHYLKQAEEALGETNAKILYLKLKSECKAFEALPVEKAIYDTLIIHRDFKTYFAIADKSATGTKYNEMLTLKIDYDELEHKQTENIPAYATKLLIAEMNRGIASANMDSIKAYLILGADVRSVDSLGWSALHWAAWFNSADVVKLLIEKRLDVNMVGRSGMTALHVAARNNAALACNVLLDKGADVKSVDSFGWSALHWAAFYNAPDVAKLLIERGANVNAITPTGMTPLHIAAQKDAVLVCNVLLDKGANINATNDACHYPPLYTAVSFNSVKTAKLLIEKGANIHIHHLWLEAANRDEQEVLDLLKKHGL